MYRKEHSIRSGKELVLCFSLYVTYTYVLERTICKVTQGSDIKWHKPLRHYGNIRAIHTMALRPQHRLLTHNAQENQKLFLVK